MAFTHLHVHTDYSLLDGLGKIHQYVKKAKEMGMTALAITDHGTGAGLPNFYNACKKEDMKPVLGCEVYVAPASRFDKEDTKKKKKQEKSEEKQDKYYHLILLVKNEIGYKNLCILISRSNTEGFYYKPRIDFALLEEYHEGLICLSACLAGEVPKKILKKDYEGARETVRRYHDLFGEDYYLEIQNHGILEEREAYEEVIRLARSENIPLVCTNDCHYVNSDDAKAHEWLLCLQTKKSIHEEHMVYQGDYSLKSEEEMRKLFPSVPDAFDNTQEIVDKIDFQFTFGQYRMPKVHIPEEYDTYFSYLKALSYEGLERRYPIGHEEREEAEQRLIFELSVIEKMNFAEYFLDIAHTIQMAHDNHIMTGPGRGSGAGSVVNYCLGITDIDPLKYNLLFERFLNPERISMPDIDMDFEYDRKDDVIKEEADYCGYEYFAKIQTFTTMQAKSVLRDMVRTAGLPASDGNRLAKMIPNENKITLDMAYEMNPDLREEIDNHEELKEIWEIAKKIEGTKKAASTHACGHICVPEKCEELFPVLKDKKTDYLVCQYDMTEAEHLGNLKKDLLMLRNLTVIQKAHDEIKRLHQVEVPLWTEEVLNDKKALKLFSTGDTGGVFQFESAGITKFMQNLAPDCFEDIIAGVSLYRPGPMDFIPDYINGKHEPKTITYLTKELEPILKHTYGQIVYQEQVMQIVQSLGGFSMGRADVVRKAMGKKKMDIMMEEKQRFVYGDEALSIKGCIKNGIKEEIAIKIYDQMIDFAKYAFNKSHAAAYAAISMQTAYLKAHYRLEFSAGLLTSVMDKTAKLARYIYEIRNDGITILPPDINTSDIGFTIEGNGIRYGLAAVKGVSEETATGVVLERKANGPYKNFTDVLRRNPKLKQNAILAFVFAGAFQSFGHNKHTLEMVTADVLKNIKKEQKNFMEGQMNLFDMEGFAITEECFQNYSEYPEEELLYREKKALDLYLTGHPLKQYTTLLKRYTNITSDKFLPVENEEEEDVEKTWDLEDKAPVKFGGMITEVKVFYTKKTGDAMAFVTLEDFIGRVSCVIFPKAYQKYKDLIVEDNKVIVNGKININDDEAGIIINDMRLLSDLPLKVFLKFKDRKEYERKKDKLGFEQQTGKDKVILFFDDEKHYEYPNYTINYDFVKKQLEKLLPKENIVVQ